MKSFRLGLYQRSHAIELFGQEDPQTFLSEGRAKEVDFIQTKTHAWPSCGFQLLRQTSAALRKRARVNGGRETLALAHRGQLQPRNCQDEIREVSIDRKQGNNEIEKKKKQLEKNLGENVDVLEFIPVLWHFQDILFKEYRKYFTEVECIKYCHNIFKTSRKNKKPKTLEWHKENCDTSLDLNASVEDGVQTYTGMDGISARLKLSDMGRN